MMTRQPTSSLIPKSPSTVAGNASASTRISTPAWSVPAASTSSGIPARNPSDLMGAHKGPLLSLPRLLAVPFPAHLSSQFRAMSNPSGRSRDLPRWHQKKAVLQQTLFPSEIDQMSLTSVVSWSLVSGYKTLLGAGRDPSCSLTSKGPTEAENAMMKHLQKLLLSLLLVTWPPVKANYSWTRREGGGEAKTHSTPYVAYLQGKNNQSCGGFLVAPNWVMTAAQCFGHKPLTVILGAHTIQKREESWQTFEVQEYHCHPDFMSPKKGNDILLLKLKGNATSNSYVRTISFEKSKVPGGTACSIAGWGYKTPTATLREATVTIIKQRDCLSHYPGLADNLICGRSGSAGVPEKSDAGDPLVCNNKAYGIFSYRHYNWPGFYTHIAPYLPWVNRVMKSA